MVSETKEQRVIFVTAAGIVVAVLAILGWSALVRTVIVPAWLQALCAYLVVWVPLGVAVIVAARVHARSAEHPLLPRPLFRPIDLLWGVGVGLMLRGVTAGIELLFLGRMSGMGVQLELDPSMIWFTLILAPVFLGPIIEELFFRGLALPALRDSALAARATPAAANTIAVVASAALFALLHTIEATGPLTATVTALSTFVFGLAAGSLVVFTKRIGGAIIAHVVYNGMLILMIVS